MNRSAAFAALLTTSLLCASTLLAQDAASGEVTVHLDLSDSVRAQLSSGRITAIKVSASSGSARGHTVDTTTATATLSDVLPGKWTLHTMMKMDGNLYVVDERGPEIEVKPGEHVDVTRTIPAFVLMGRVTLRGQPFHGLSQSLATGDSLCRSTKTGDSRFRFPMRGTGTCRCQRTGARLRRSRTSTFARSMPCTN